MSQPSTPKHIAFEKTAKKLLRPTSIFTATGLVAAAITAPFISIPAWAADCTVNLTGVDETDRDSVQAKIDDDTCDVVLIEADGGNDTLDLTGLEPLVIETVFDDARQYGGFTLKSTTGVELTRTDGLIVSISPAPPFSSSIDPAPILIIDNNLSSSPETGNVVIEGLKFTEGNYGGIDATNFGGWRALALVDTHFENLGGISDAETFNYGLVSVDLGDSQIVDFTIFQGDLGVVAIDYDQDNLAGTPYVPTFLAGAEIYYTQNEDLIDNPQGFLDILAAAGINDTSLFGIFNSTVSPIGAVRAATTIGIDGSTFINNASVLSGNIGYGGTFADTTEANAVATVTDLFNLIDSNESLYPIDGLFGSYGPVTALYPGFGTSSDVYITDSTFTGNRGYDGGAVFSDGDAFIENSDLSNNRATEDGGALNADDLTVRSSSFVGNTAGVNGGAIYSEDDIFVGSSLFSLNEAGNDGGAVWSDDDFTSVGSGFDTNTAGANGGAVYSYYGSPEIHTSTFVNNQATSGNGGVLWSYDSDGSGYFYNSSFVGNSAPNGYGGAFFSKAGEYVNLTFVDNYAGYDGQSVFVRSSDKNAKFVGNIFANSSYSAFEVYDSDPISITDGGGNITTSEFETWMGDSSTLDADYSALKFVGSVYVNPTLETPNPVVKIGAGSLAIDYVPAITAESYPWLFSADNDMDSLEPGDISVPPYMDNSDYPYATWDFDGWINEGYTDQIGTARNGRWDTGAFEFGGGVAALASRPFPAVLEINPSRVTISNEIITLFGANLGTIRSIFINGKEIKIKTQSNNRITFRAPVGLVGFYDLTLVPAGFDTIVIEDALNFGAAVANGARTLVPGFAANSAVLSKVMKKEIRTLLKQNPTLTTASCKGFTSAPATKQDAKLARKRGKAACAYIKSIRPDMTVKVVKGEHTEQPGQSIRRVRITLR